MGNLDKYLQSLRNRKILLDNQVRIIKFKQKKRNNFFFFQLVDIWFAQVLDGLMYLWNQNIVHQ